MKKMLFALLTTVIIFAGCSNTVDKPAPAEEATTAAVETATGTAIETTAPATAFEVDQVVTITGHTGCAHCSFHVADSCAAAIQSNDGQVIVLDVPEDHELFTSRYDGKQVTIEGTVVDAGTPPHIAVTNFSFES